MRPHAAGEPPVITAQFEGGTLDGTEQKFARPAPPMFKRQLWVPGGGWETYDLVVPGPDDGTVRYVVRVED